MPLDLDSMIPTQLDILVPQLKADIRRAYKDLDTEVDSVVLGPLVPPVPVLQLEVLEWDGAKVGLDFADGSAG